jgi:sarcosine oxidase
LHRPGALTDPDLIAPPASAAETRALQQMLDRYFPGIFHRFSFTKTCLYTNSPDENFIIDFLPGSDNCIVIAAGFSGHGFKFASVVGEILADLALDENTDMPVGFLSFNRLQNNV